MEEKSLLNGKYSVSTETSKKIVMDAIILLHKKQEETHKQKEKSLTVQQKQNLHKSKSLKKAG